MSRKAAYQRERRARLHAAGGSSSGKQAAAGGTREETKVQGLSNVNPRVTRAELNADNPNAIEELRAMAERGETPVKITGHKENRERIYEEMDKLYAAPVGALSEYTIRPLTPSPVEYKLRVDFDNFARAMPSRVDVPRRTTSEAAKRGAIKHAIYNYRPFAEQMYMFREGKGSYWDDKGGSDAWRDRIFSSKERNETIQDMLRGIERTFGTPATEQGKKYIESGWTKVGDGWKIEN